MVEFNLPADGFPKAILEFYHQSNIEVLFIANDSLRAITTQPVAGQLEPREALDRMMQGTGLTYDFDTDRSVIIHQPDFTGVDFNTARCKVKIPAGNLSGQLHLFSRQCHIGFLVAASRSDQDIESARGRHSVSGDLKAAEALRRLLANTGWTFIVKPPDGVTIVPDRHTLLARIRNWWRREILRGEMSEIVVAAAKPVTQIVPQPGDPVLSYGRSDFDATGFSSLPDFLATIPEIFGGGPNEYSAIGREANTNSTKGYCPNIRGMDCGEAVILVDGIRMAGSGTAAEYNDVSMLPLSAIERIDIVADGASPRYGSDAVSGVINFETRADFSGIETQVIGGQSTSGSPAERQVGQLLGTHWSDGQAYLALEYYDRGALAPQDRPQATSNLQPWGGPNLDMSYGYPGNITVGSQTWAILSTHDGRPILGTAGSQNLYDQWQDRDILPWQQRFSALGRFSITTDNAEYWSSFLLSSRHATSLVYAGATAALTLPSTNPGYVNPTGGTAPVTVQYGFGRVLGPSTSDDNAVAGTLAAGASFQVAGWNLSTTASGSWEGDRALAGNYVNFVAISQALNSTTPSTQFNPFASTTPASVVSSLRETDFYESHSDLDTFDATASRHVLSSMAGDVNATLGAQYRRETLTAYSPDFALAPPRQDLHRNVGALFGELNVPLLSPQNAVAGLRRLDLSLGERYEEYSDAGGVFAPKITVSMSPLDALTIRGTFSHSYRPPALTDEVETGNLSAFYPLSNGQKALVVTGGNAELRPETARTWTGGAEYTWDSKLSVSATYYDINSTGRVVQPEFTPTLTDFDGIVIHDPTASQRNFYCAHSQFIEGGMTACERSPFDLIVDTRLQNSLSLTTSGIDIGARYTYGGWNIRFDATDIFGYSETTVDGHTVELLDTPYNPVGIRATATISKSFLGFTGTVATHFTGQYYDTSSSPRRRVGSWETFDIKLARHFGQSDERRGIDLWMGANNLFDRQPPYVADEQSYASAAWDPANGGDLLGRMVTAGVRVDW